MIYNPILSIVKFIYLLVLGKIKQHKDTIFKKLSFNNNDYVIFRHISVVQNEGTENSAVLVLRFKFKHSSLKKDKIISFFQIPIFAGLPGFQGKLWTFDKKNGVFQGVYQWKSKEHIQEYLDLFAVNFVRKKQLIIQ